MQAEPNPAGPALTEWALTSTRGRGSRAQEGALEQGQLGAGDTSCELPWPPALPRNHSGLVVDSNCCGSDAQRERGSPWDPCPPDPSLHPWELSPMLPMRTKGSGKRERVSLSVSSEI